MNSPLDLAISLQGALPTEMLNNIQNAHFSCSGKILKTAKLSTIEYRKNSFSGLLYNKKLNKDG